MIYLTMEFPDQPPPDAPAPPPGKEARRSRAWMISLLVFGGISAAITSFGVYVLFFYKKPSPDRIEAIHNVKQLHLALFDFESDYGRFPDSTTISSVQKSTGTTVSLGTSSSNDFFRQLLVAVAKSESIFWAKSTVSPR